MSESSVPSDLRYSTDHEWVRLDGELATIGITDYAQEALGDIVFVSLPDVGAEVAQGQECGEVESTKSVSPLISPVSGRVAEVNTALTEGSEPVNSDPYGDGWMFKVELSDSASVSELMDSTTYTTLIA